MKLFSKYNQIFLFLVFIAHQNAIAVPLTKAEAHKAMILNNHLRTVALRLQSEPFKSEISRKSAELTINELERLGQKDPDSSFAKDAQKWREEIGRLASMSRGAGKGQLIDAEKIAAAKSEVDRSLEAIKKQQHNKFFTKEQKEFIAINEAEVIKSAETELRLLAADKKQLLSRAEEIKKEYKNAIVEYKKKNQQALRKQLGSAIDVSKEVELFNKRIDAIVKNIIKEEREPKRKQPGGLSLEDTLDEFNDFILDKINQARESKIVDEQKTNSDQALFEIVDLILASLKGHSLADINSAVKHVKDQYAIVIDQQYNPGMFYTYFGYDSDTKRKNAVNNKIDEMFFPLLESVQLSVGDQAELVEEEQLVEKQGAQEPYQEEIEIPLTAPKRPSSSKTPSVQQLSQPKKEQQQGPAQPDQPVQQKPVGQQEQLKQELSEQEQFEQMKTNFTDFIKRMIEKTKEENIGTSTIYGNQQTGYDDSAIDKAKSMVDFLVSHSGVAKIEDVVESIRTEYTKAIDDQVAANENYVRLHGDNSTTRKNNFINKLDAVVKSVQK